MGVRPQHFKLIIKMNNQIYYITDTKLVDMSLLEDGCIVMLNIDSLISLLKLKNRDNLELFKQFCISYREYSYEVGAFTLIHKDIFHLVISKDEELEKYINAQWIFPTHEPRFYERGRIWDLYVNTKREDENEYVSLDKWGYNAELGLFSKVEYPNLESAF